MSNIDYTQMLTAEQRAAAEAPSPIALIRAAEADLDMSDRIARASRLAVLQVARDRLSKAPSAAGKTELEIHEWCYAHDSDYHALWDLEEFCKAQRKLM